MNRRQILRAAVLLPATLAAACGRGEAGPVPIATIAVSSAQQTQSSQTEGGTKAQTKPTFIEFYAEW